MPNPVWPASLPQAPETPSYRETRPDQILRTGMDSGPAKLRRRFTAQVRETQMAFIMTRAQVATFDSFVENDLNAGALPFTFTDVRRQVAVTLRLREPPSYQTLGPDVWRVTVPAEIMP